MKERIPELPRCYLVMLSETKKTKIQLSTGKPDDRFQQKNSRAFFSWTESVWLC